MGRISIVKNKKHELSAACRQMVRCCGNEESGGQGTRDKGQGTRDKGQGTKDKGQGIATKKANLSLVTNL
jgi:hypothetical protein